MSIDKVQVTRRFNRAVSTYDQYAIIQQQMAHRLLQHLTKKVTSSPRRICEVGCGTGYFTDLLLQHYPESELVAIDLASQMIERAKTRVNHPHIEWVVGDAEQLHQLVSGPFDLIVSNASIQWLSDPQRTLFLWREALNPGGLLIASTFGVDTFHEMSSSFKKAALELGMPPCQHHLTMYAIQDWREWLEQGGFSAISIEESHELRKYPDSRALMQSIKATGASYSKATWSRRLLQKVMAEYNERYREESHVLATYHVLYLLGKNGDGSGAF